VVKRPARRGAYLLALALACGAMASLCPAVVQAAPARSTYWPMPLVYSAPPTETAVVQRPATFRMGAGAGGEFVFRKMRWTGWGAPTAVGRGEVRSCATDGSGCSLPWSRVRLELFRLRPSGCGDEEGVFGYTRYRGFGIPYARKDGAAWRSERIC
jgi:hypothetical protein